jgi:hypothetical protein
MMTTEKLLAWLKAANARYRAKGLPPKQRSIEAIKDLVGVIGSPIEFTSPVAKTVFAFFEQQTKEGSQTFGLLYRGAYFFDASFFPVAIEIPFGSPQLDPFKALTSMPEQMQADIKSDPQEKARYEEHWLVCRDYALAHDILDHGKVTNRLAKDFLRNGRKNLEGVVAQLLETRAISAAIMGTAMVVELYLKAFLIDRVGKDEDFVKYEVGHKLSKAIEECLAFTSIPELLPAQTNLALFPKIEDRYTGPDRSEADLWKTYQLAQQAASAVVRLLSR